jgi:hypothetical protein
MTQRSQLFRTVEWFGYAIGLALLLWGVANAAILVATGGSWQGPLSLRKPAAFGVSFGLTLVTIVWVASWMQLKDRSRNLILGVFAFLCVAETALISLQAWRGVPSHFNEATPFDAGVTRLLAGFGAALVITIATLTLASFRANQGTGPAMRIAIIGTGNVGSALGGGWAALGHDVVFGARDPRLPRVHSVVKAAGGRARATLVREASAVAEVVVLATPWEATEAAVRAAGDLAGKVLVDATNPLSPDLRSLAVGHTTSGAEEVARWAPGARVVKAFNTIGAQHMRDPRFGSETASMFVCGDDEPARRLVMGLAGALGFECVDAGPLVQARLLEPLAMLWISLAYAQGQGTGIAFRLVRKPA